MFGSHQISGDDTIGQILVSLEKYQCRYKLFLLSLNRFFEVIKNENLPLDLQARALDVSCFLVFSG